MDAFRTRAVGPVQVAIANQLEARRWVKQAALSGYPVAVRFGNANTVASAFRDQTYRVALQTSGITFADGKPVQFVLRHLRRERRAGQVRGPALFAAFLEDADNSGVKHFFLGSDQASLNSIFIKLNQQFPFTVVAGRYAPGYEDLTDDLLDSWAAQIRTSGANVVWIGLGGLKQDMAAIQLAERLNMPCLGVGAAFDFYSGHKREAPKFIQLLGLEWAHRLASEPRRLWRRYLIGNATFLLALVRHPGG